MKKKGEKIAVCAVFLLLGAVVVSQIFLRLTGVESAFGDLKVQRRDNTWNTAEKKAQLVLETDRPEPGVFVLVNGRKKENFFNKKITISVPEYSLIQVSAEGVEHAVRLEVTRISDFVKCENLNLKAVLFGKKFCVGRILFQ